ncbi:MAG: acylneuraminate cytidylyltransferase family protein [Prochlorococcus marinus CUG1438]|nr:acylneuraminate cytidylyltransferase family protein [Prochlorococcus marinus CUG1438]
MTLFGKSILAVVPARGGSKGIPRKNLRKISGKSLIKHASEICKALPFLDYSIISTDDKEMASEARDCGLEVPFIRPEILGTDNASSVDMWTHAWITSEKILKKKFDISILLEPTSPLRVPKDIELCLTELIKNDYPAVATVSLMPAHYRPQKALEIKNDGKIGFYLPNDNSYVPRQKIPPYFYRNGICYALTRKKLIEEKTILDESCHAILINREVINIDDPFDLELAEFLFKRSLRK